MKHPYQRHLLAEYCPGMFQKAYDLLVSATGIDKPVQSHNPDDRQATDVYGYRVAPEQYAFTIGDGKGVIEVFGPMITHELVDQVRVELAGIQKKK